MRDNGTIVGCEEVESEVFGRERDGEGESGSEDSGVGCGADEEDDDDDDEGGGVRLSSTNNSPSKATTITPTKQSTKHLIPQAQGLQRARQREQVRQAARRGAAFGFPLPRRNVGGQEQEEEKEKRMRVEAVQNGRVIEASFAKGEWGVRLKG